MLFYSSLLPASVCTPLPSTSRICACFLHSLSVFFATTGLATKLMNAAHREMQEVFDAHYVSLHVRKSNTAAFHLYTQTLAYETHDIEAKYYADGEDAYDMRKPFGPMLERRAKEKAAKEKADREKEERLQQNRAKLAEKAGVASTATTTSAASTSSSAEASGTTAAAAGGGAAPTAASKNKKKKKRGGAGGGGAGGAGAGGAAAGGAAGDDDDAPEDAAAGAAAGAKGDAAPAAAQPEPAAAAAPAAKQPPSVDLASLISKLEKEKANAAAAKKK